jgi:hypothetical protein
MNDLDRDRVDIVTAQLPSDDCVLWPGPLFPSGYGRIRVGGRSTNAHRVIYEMTSGGPVPPDLYMDHLCRVRPCVNPDHLEPVTPGENTYRGFEVKQEKDPRAFCRNGHSWDANTYLRPSGHRDCRVCIRQRVADYKARKAAA